MTDTVNDPAQQGNPGQQSGNPQVTPTENWEVRYKGSVRTIEQLTLKVRELEGQLVQKSSETEQLNAQLALKETEKTVAVGERDKQLNDILQAKSQADQELAALRALKLKIEVARELNNPDLIKIIDRIPSVGDKEALTAIMKDFANWGDEIAKTREKQILAGYTPPVSASSVKVAPTSHDAWQKEINSLPLGSPERAKAMEDYWIWGQANQ